MRSPLPVTACTLLLAAWPAFTATPHSPPPVLEFGETRPLETALGDSSLPATGDLWVDMIRSARRSLDLEHFYLSRQPGEALDPVLDEIGRAAARGVRVRLLLDAGMHATYPQPADSLSRLAGMSVRRVNYRRLAGGVQHAKFMVVDDTEAWIGSPNLDWRALSHIHELGLRVRSEPVARALADVFETDWAAADTTTAAQAPQDRRSVEWPLVFEQEGERGELWLSASPRTLTPASIPWDQERLLDIVNRAQREIVAQVLTYGVGGRGTVDSTLHRALIAAARRGVQVKLVVSDWVAGGRGEADLRALAAVPNLQVRISSIAEYSGGYIPFARVDHCKYMVADSTWLWLGTSNWEPSYFVTSRNVAITAQHPPTARRARGIFATSWDAPQSRPLTADARLERRPHAETPPPGATVYGK